MMKYNVVAGIMLFGACFTVGGELSVGKLRVQWEDGWRRTDEKDLVRYISPAPVRTAVTIDSTDQEGDQDGPREYATSQLPAVLRRHGKIVVPLKSESLDSGAVLFTIASYDEKRDYFGIIFVHVSRKGRMSQFAIEGNGRPEKLLPVYRAYAASARWIDEV